MTTLSDTMSATKKAAMKLLDTPLPDTLFLPRGPTVASDAFGWSSYRTYIAAEAQKYGAGGRFVNEANAQLFMEAIDKYYPDLTWQLAYSEQPLTEAEAEFCRRHATVVAIHGEAERSQKKRTPQKEVTVAVANCARIIHQTLHPLEYHICLKDAAMAMFKGQLFVQPPTALMLTDFREFEDKMHLFSSVTPEMAVMDAECRTILTEIMKHPEVRVEPQLRKRIENAIIEARRVAVPIMPPTEFERIAYCEEESDLRCLVGWGPFKAGRTYKVTCLNYNFTKRYSRKKSHFNEKTGESRMEMHDCQLLGQDRKVRVYYGTGAMDYVDFMHEPSDKNERELPEVNLWGIFARPVVRTVLEAFPEMVQEISDKLDTLESIGDMTFLPGQREYLKRVLCKDHALFAARTGTGKSLMTITTYNVKDAHRCLIVCPKGTVDNDGDEGDPLAQWVSEVTKFAPHIPVFTLFDIEDYKKICSQNNGVLPHGIYLTYYEAMFQNGGIESCNKRNNAWLYKQVDFPLPEDVDAEGTDITDSIGMESADGIRCIVKPCLSTLIGDQFDMVCLDEAHKLQNISSNRTQMAIRMQPKYRYAFTATPIPNNATDLFAIIGWLCVPKWYQGGVCNAAFPFRREDEGSFSTQFLTRERDLTRELQWKSEGGEKKRRKSVNSSPVLSAPARLLKILKPTIAYITKEQCNPAYIPPTIRDIRVPLGSQQAALYNHYTNPNNIPGKNALARFGNQVNALRAVCTDPCGSQYNKFENPKVTSNFNPKLVAILEIIRDRIREGKQTVVVNARTGINTELHNRLEEAGVRVSRIDSTKYSGNHAQEANDFKAKKTEVMLMGLRCAMGHSFDQCDGLIVGSIDYSPGPFEQALGRVDRVTSKGATIYCILNENTIEELQFDTMALKDDASKIVLRGERVPRDFKPVDMSEVLVESLINWANATAQTMDEATCEQNWPTLREQLLDAVLLAC